MKKSLTQPNLAIYTIAFVLLTAFVSNRFSHYKLAGMFDVVYATGFPLTFYYTGGFFNIHQFLPVPFLFDVIFALSTVFVFSKISDKVKQKSH